MEFSSTTAGAAADDGGATSLAVVHPEIIRTHILARLDGPALAAASSSSSLLHALISSDDELWRDICRATWPSTAHPRLRGPICAFPSGHRSFFSDSFPLLRLRNRAKPNHLHRPFSQPPSELISAVDVHYQGNLVFSEITETETASSGWFGSAPFRIDLLPEEDQHPAVIPIPEKFGTTSGTCGRQLEENLTVSWIMVDPTRSRAANISSRRAVSARPRRRRWSSSSSTRDRDEDVEIRYSTVVGGGGRRGSATEMVELAVVVVVTRGGEGGGEAHVREVGFRAEDMEGRILSGEESMAIIGDAIGRSAGRERNCYYKEYVEMRRERRERKERRERVIDMACMAVGISIFFSLWCFLLLR